MKRSELIELIREEVEQAIHEREMNKKQKRKKEDIVQNLKDKAPEMKKRYGKNWKNVMYATATKLAQSSVPDKKEDKEDND